MAHGGSSAHPLLLQTPAGSTERTRGIWGSWRMGWEAGDLQLWGQPLSSLVALGGLCRTALVPREFLAHAHTPGAWQGSRARLGRVSCPLELGTKDWNTLRSLRASLPWPVLITACLCSTLGFPGKKQGTGTGFSFCIPSAPEMREISTLLPLHHCHSWTASQRTSNRCCSNTAAFNTHFLVPLVLSLTGHSRLLLLGPA